MNPKNETGNSQWIHFGSIVFGFVNVCTSESMKPFLKQQCFVLRKIKAFKVSTSCLISHIGSGSTVRRTALRIANYLESRGPVAGISESIRIEAIVSIFLVTPKRYTTLRTRELIKEGRCLVLTSTAGRVESTRKCPSDFGGRIIERGAPAKLATKFP